MVECQAPPAHGTGGVEPSPGDHRPHGLQAHLLEDDQPQSKLEEGQQVRSSPRKSALFSPLILSADICAHSNQA
jgi:hypothetical protein